MIHRLYVYMEHHDHLLVDVYLIVAAVDADDAGDDLFHFQYDSLDSHSIQLNQFDCVDNGMVAAVSDNPIDNIPFEKN